MSQQGRLRSIIVVLILAILPCFGQPNKRRERLSHLPGSALFFESKAGYVSMTPDAKAYFLKDHVVYKIRDLAFHMEFLGASPDIDPQGEEPQATRVNYLVGNREQDWSTNLRTYKTLAYRGIYPGVDVRFGFSGSRLKSEFIVAPGGDPNLVRIRYSGLGLPQIEETGDLKFVSERGEFREELPAVYQMSGAMRIDVPAKYKIWNDGAIGFELGAFDGALPLIIDPLVVYSSYLGAHGDTAATAVAVDSNGNAYVAGWTDSLDLPVAVPIQAFNAGNVDAFVMKLNSAGNTLLYATYIGGSGDDRAYGIAVDSGGNAYITGTTASSNFPVQVPLQIGLSGARDAFVLKLNAAGNNLTFSTFLGGVGSETGYGIALDTQANAYVTGDTTSSNFPTRTPFQSSLKGAQDAFVTKISAAGALLYSTYLGGSASEHGAAIAVDAAGEAYVTGGTFSTNFPTLSAFQAANAGGQDAFVTKFGSGGNSLVYSSYLGGSGGALGSMECGAGIALDVQGRATVVGTTSSANFPVAAAFQPALGGGLSNAFVTQFTLAGTALVYSTYFGGSTSDYGQAIALDLAGNAYATGFTGSLDIPTLASAQSGAGGGYDAFVLVLNSTGTTLRLATYYGGSGLDTANGIAVDPSGNAVIAGQTTSANFPITGGVQSVMLGSIEAFVVKLNPGFAQPDFSLNMSPNPANVAPGGTVNYTVTSTALNGFGGSVSLAVSGLPPGVTGSFNPPSITGSGSSILTISATLGASLGNFTTTVTGTKASLIHTTSATLNVASGSTGPIPVSISPSSGSGSSQIFTGVFSDADGAGDIKVVKIQFNNSVAITNACTLVYKPAPNAVNLGDDSGALQAGIIIGTPGTLSNSQCTLDAGASSAVSAGNTLTVNLAVTFKPSFAGAQLTYLKAKSPTIVGDWLQLGTWTVTGASSGPTPVSISPSSGSGSPQTFVGVFSDSAGAGDIAVARIQLGSSLAGNNACSVVYKSGPNSVLLLDDSGSLVSGIVIGTPGTLSNSQCSVDVGASSVVSSGNTLTLTVAVTFTPAFAGAQITYLEAKSSTIVGDWLQFGTWNVP